MNEQIIDVSKIKIVPSDTEIPVHNNLILTKRPLCTNFPENSTILDRTEAIKIITDISEDLNKSEEVCVNKIPQYIEDLQAIFNPLTAQECTSDLFKDEEYTIIETLDELKKYLSELLIRFDTSPNNYTKEDYLYLLSILYKSLIYLYLINPASVITTEWTDPLTDNLVPSEKLVKETIDSVESLLDEKINQEIEDRLSADESLSDDIAQEIEDRQSEISRVEGLIDDINELIPEEASSSNQLADKDYVDQNIATSSATFKGTYNSIQELEQVIADNNDYAFVISSDLYGNTVYNRYKYDGTQWLFEYALNNDSFTQSLWNAINSGITSEKVATYDGYLPLILAAL